MKKAKIVQKENVPEVPAEVIAQCLVDIADAAKKLAAGKLKREAIVTLIKDKTGVHKTTIHLVMDSLESLKQDWLK